MTKERFDSLYVGENIFVNCKTEKLERQFLTLADSFGYTWVSGGKYTKSTFLYILDLQHRNFNIQSGTHAPLRYLKEKGYTAVNYIGGGNIVVKYSCSASNEELEESGFIPKERLLKYIAGINTYVHKESTDVEITVTTLSTQYKAKLKNISVLSYITNHIDVEQYLLPLIQKGLVQEL